MYVTKEFIIDGNVVNKIGDLPGLEVYEYEGATGDAVMLYFVKGNEVVATYTADADCGQNMGYISETCFKQV